MHPLIYLPDFLKLFKDLIDLLHEAVCRRQDVYPLPRFSIFTYQSREKDNQNQGGQETFAYPNCEGYNERTKRLLGGFQMAETVSQTLSEELFKLLQKERFVTLGTVDHESGAPSLSSLSWTFAASADTIRFAVDNRSRILANIAKEPQVVLHLIGAGSSFAINGRATVKAERLEGVPLKLAMAEIKIEAVRDIMFYGSRISVEPGYEKTYDKNAAAKLDNQVMTALREAN